MKTATFTLLNNFLPNGSYDGLTGEDSHGKYILFPKELHNTIFASCFLKTETNDIIQIHEERRELVDGIPMLKVYYE